MSHLSAEEIKLLREVLAKNYAKIEKSMSDIQQNVSNIHEYWTIHPVYSEMALTKHYIDHSLAKTDGNEDCDLCYDKPFTVQELETCLACLVDYRKIMKKLYIPRECPDFIWRSYKDTLWILSDMIRKFEDALVPF